jgi:hypothetical protein
VIETVGIQKNQIEADGSPWNLPEPAGIYQNWLEPDGNID